MKVLFVPAIAFIGFATPSYGWSLFSRSAPDPETATLSDYKGMNTKARGEFLEKALPMLSEDALDHVDQYRNCLGYNAPIKRDDLPVMRVLGWCDAERMNAPDRFAGHFNDLEAADHSTEARGVCRELVKREMVAPATAKFAMFDRSERHRGSWEYAVTGKVDSDNAFGVTFSFRFYCTMQYSGEGDPNMMSSWSVSEFTVEPARS